MTRKERPRRTTKQRRARQQSVRAGGDLRKYRYVFRSAVTGFFVSASYAKRYPRRTVKERIGCGH